MIRFAKEEDTAIILEFIKELAEYEHLLEEVSATYDVLYDSLFVKKQAEVLLFEEEGKPVGFALFFHNFSTFLGKANLYLEDLYVRPPYRGKGYGKALFVRLAQIAVVRNCERLDWWCLDWNTSSIAFYQSLGAVGMEDWTVYRLQKDSLHALAKQSDEKLVNMK